MDGGYLGKYESHASLLQFLTHVWMVSTKTVSLSCDGFSVGRFKPNQLPVGTIGRGLVCVNTSKL